MTDSSPGQALLNCRQLPWSHAIYDLPTGTKWRKTMEIRRAAQADFDFMWPIFREVIASGDTYVFSPDTPREDAFVYWFGSGVTSYVAEAEGRIVGMYKIVQNHRDRGSHIANASFMVAPLYSARGVGRQMGLHALREARQRGFLGMQFNFVVSTNAAAIALWKSLGFAIVGTLPRAFSHGDLGYVDAYLMYRSLEGDEPGERPPEALLDAGDRVADQKEPRDRK